MEKNDKRASFPIHTFKCSILFCENAQNDFFFFLSVFIIN